ncbi:hypothetical protein ACMC56_01150 [Campylobacterota bacterium DY0563]
MYELEKVNQNILTDFYECILKELIKKDKTLLMLSIRYAVKKMNPHTFDSLLAPKIRQIGKTLDFIIERKIEKFNSLREAQDLFKEQFSEEYNNAIENPFEPFSELVLMAYDLCKYDTKVTYKNKVGFFNLSFLIKSFRLHYKADFRWLKERNIKPNERNINISLNTNKALNDQVKFLESSYELYKDNPYSKDFTKDIELGVIDGYKEDKHMMARSIYEITNVHYSVKDLQNEESKTIINAFKNLKHSLDSDKPIDRTDIINSWLTHIAILYIRINPQGIKKTELSEFIVKIANCTTIYKEDTTRKLFSPEKLRKNDFREKAFYKKLRLMEITDKRYKLSFNEKTIKEIEEYITHIITYLSKHQKTK